MSSFPARVLPTSQSLLKTAFSCPGDKNCTPIIGLLLRKTLLAFSITLTAISQSLWHNQDGAASVCYSSKVCFKSFFSAQEYLSVSGQRWTESVDPELFSQKPHGLFSFQSNVWGFTSGSAVGTSVQLLIMGKQNNYHTVRHNIVQNPWKPFYSFKVAVGTVFLQFISFLEVAPTLSPVRFSWTRTGLGVLHLLPQSCCCRFNQAAVQPIRRPLFFWLVVYSTASRGSFVLCQGIRLRLRFELWVCPAVSSYTSRITGQTLDTLQ